MTRIAATFGRLRERGEKALIAYVTAGDPDLASTPALVLELARQGADIIELGVPFSDPFADGVAIQAAMLRARKAGTTLEGVLDACRKIREASEVPIVLFGYYNPIFVRGCDRFAKEAVAAGVDGVLTVDLPPEEADELVPCLRNAGLDWIPLLAPTSTEARIGRAAALGSGFLYYVSLTGVTGATLSGSDEVEQKVKELRKQSSLPIAVGFGVERPEQAAALGRFADGVVVGSALVKAHERGGAKEAGALASALKQSLRGRS